MLHYIWKLDRWKIVRSIVFNTWNHSFILKRIVYFCDVCSLVTHQLSIWQLMTVNCDIFLIHIFCFFIGLPTCYDYLSWLVLWVYGICLQWISWAPTRCNMTNITYWRNCCTSVISFKVIGFILKLCQWMTKMCNSTPVTTHSFIVYLLNVRQLRYDFVMESNK